MPTTILPLTPIRRALIAAALAGSLLAPVSPALASDPVVSRRTPPVITVQWSDYSTGIFVTSPNKITNVVLLDCLDLTYKYDHLDEDRGNFEHPSGQPITIVWVKSGNNESGDGPGYGERFENPDHDENCVVGCKATNACDPMPNRKSEESE